MNATQFSWNSLAAAITYAASRQTYYTIRFLADRDRVQNAYRAYAYFRWVDDCLDTELESRSDRLRFTIRQESLLGALTTGRECGRLTPEENMLADLIASDPAPESGLRTYLHHMMAVMAFDAQRRRHLISQAELDSYTRHLAIAVTENLHYFIGHGKWSPHDGSRYAAVTAAHVAHMLRDTQDDLESGYFNIPREVLRAASIRPDETDHPVYRAWVSQRVKYARQQFSLARGYLSRVQSLRCRLAGYTYMSRFMSVLAMIERDNYLIRHQYPTRRSLSGFMSFLESLHTSLFEEPGPKPAPMNVSVRELGNKS